MDAVKSVTATFDTIGYTVTTASGGNGTITPASTNVTANGSIALTITPATGFLPSALDDSGTDVLASLKANANGTYTYTVANVTSIHNITVTFAAARSVSATVSGNNGAVTPTKANVPSGGSSIITIMPAPGYIIDTITDNDATVTATGNLDGTSTYSLSNVITNHGVKVSFKLDPAQSNQQVNSTQAPAASDVGVTVAAAELYFDTITTPGAITLTTLDMTTLPAFPDGYQPVNGSSYNVAVGATYQGAVRVCLNYNVANLPDSATEAKLQMFHFDAISWNNVTQWVDMTNKVVCGQTASFSPLVLGAPTTNGASSTTTYTINPVVAANEGGTINPATPQTVLAGGGVTFTFTPDSGYRLLDVKIGAYSVGPRATYTINSVQANLDVVATFVPITYTLTAAADANGAISPTGTGVVRPGDSQSYVITATPGYSILNLTDNTLAVTTAAGSASFTYNLTNIQVDHVIRATFQQNNPATITAASDNFGSISPSGTKMPYLAGQSPTFSFIPNLGYKVGSITVDGTPVAVANFYTFANLTAADHTIAVTFVPDTLTITATVLGQGTIDQQPVNAVTRGTTVAYTCTPDSGYQLSSVVVNGSSQPLGSYTFTNVQVNQTISFTFVPITWNISASAGANGSINPSGNFSVNQGSNQTFTVSANPSYVIDTLTDNGTSVASASGQASYSYPLTSIQASHTIAVTFKQNVATATISATVTNVTGVNGNGSGSINQPLTNPVALGSNVVYTFNPAPGSRVGSVIVDGANKGALASYTFKNVQTAHTIIVNFVYDEYTINISVPGRNMGTVTNSLNGTVINSGTNTTQTVVKNGSVTYTFNPNTGYTVSSVLVNGSSKGAITSYTFSNVTMNQSLSVTFVKTP